MNKLYHFLGGVYFAILLIASIALCVIAGTFLESSTESHRYASYFTYDNPLFTLLLSCLFVNILFSATRRYPFKIKHLPFLITHLGLLMILSGVFIKNSFGTQGTLVVLEGSTSDEIAQANRYDILMESRTNRAKFSLENPAGLDGVKIKVAAYAPHSSEQYETWIKEGRLFILGMQPLPLGVSGRHLGWNVIAYESENYSPIVQEAYFHNLQVVIRDTQCQEIVFQGSSNDAKNYVSLTLQLDPARLDLVFADGSLGSIPLSGPESLKNEVHGSYFKCPLYTIDLVQQPTLLFIKTSEQKTHLFALDAYGGLHTQTLDADAIPSYIAYDSGFGGYSVPVAIPYLSKSRSEQEAADIAFLKSNLRESIKANQTISPPLYVFRTYCEENGKDFADACIDFLVRWHKNREPISEIQQFSPSACELIPQKDLQACHWISVLLQEIEPRLTKGEPLLDILESMEWPLLDGLRETAGDPVDALTYQIYAVAEELPKPKAWNYPGILSAYFRLYGIQFHTVSSMIRREPPLEMTLECPLNMRRESLPPGKKLEDNCPQVTLLLDDGVKKELLSLTYQKGGGLKWPAFEGKYLFRFQPCSQAIPYTVRLRNAREIRYPGTLQAYSYESDLIITDKRDGKETETTISMNNVHETWDGYRFYLSNISPDTETTARYVQIAVNHDPAKYFVTYPGAAISSLGIFLLFWMRPYGRKYF